MSLRSDHGSRPDERGISLVEVLIALVVLSVGIMAIGGMFPAGTRTEVQTRMQSNANYFAQLKLEELRAIPWNDPALNAGRHPAGIVCDTLGTTKAWRRFYQVDLLAAPLADLKRVSVNVSWTYLGTRSVIDTIYVRK
jgi:prepilin-type N-terminal cleavage/methylation domain-containing protein